MRMDTEWRKAAEQYRHLKNEADSLNQLMADAKDTLLSLAGEEDAAGFGVSVKHGTRKGTIDYETMVAALNINAELFRKASIQTVTVNISKGE